MYIFVLKEELKEMHNFKLLIMIYIYIYVHVIKELKEMHNSKLLIKFLHEEILRKGWKCAQEKEEVRLPDMI